MLKIIGLIMLTVSCGLGGISKTTQLKRRVYLLEDFFQMIIILKTNISYFKEPLPDLFSKVGKNSQSKAFSFLKELGLEIHSKQGEIANFWSKIVKRTYEREPLKATDLDIMSFPGEFIGQTDYENQIAHFTYLEEQLKTQIKTAKDELASKAPMYNKIGFFVGGIIAILFI